MPDIYEKIPDFSASNDYVISATELKKAFEAIERDWPFPNNGISANKGGKNPMKFTFYVTEGTRVDKSCNGTIPTMTTNIELSDGNVFDEVTTVRGSATCDKADYDERQGVLEALANAVCGGEFEKRYKKAVKANKDADLWMRTCYYCGKVFDTVEEKWLTIIGTLSARRQDESVIFSAKEQRRSLLRNRLRKWQRK